VNHSANRTWYFPNMYMGEYPVNYSSAVDISSVELYWDVPGDPLYQQFVYAFMQGITHERGASVWIQPSAHGISGISSPWKSSFAGSKGHRGACIRSSSSPRDARSISSCTSPT
jgi:hypothetical protein